MDRSALLTHPDDKTSIAQCVRHGVNYDPDTTAMLQQAIQPGDVACDIGANFGYFTNLMADLSSHVYAFEPAPSNFFYLKANTEDRDNVSCYPCALSDEDGFVDLFLNKDHFGECSLTKDNVPDVETNIRVKTRTLDSFDFVPQVVKCDAQAAEPKIFRKATKLLSQPRVFIIFEFWPIGIHNSGENPWDFIMSFQNHGLSLGLFAEGALRVVKDGVAVKIGATSSPNFVAFRGYDHLIAS